MQSLDLSSIPPMPWKNGGGTTRELACWPPGSTLENFEWRVSVASVAGSCTFSAFAGVDRQITLLEGSGLRLHRQDSGAIHALDVPWCPQGFPGEAAIDCTLLGGPSSDFNLMVRRARWQGQLRVVREACVPGSTPAGLCMVLAGRWRHGDAVLAPGQGLWWSQQQASPALTPVNEPAPALAWIVLSPAPSFNPPPQEAGAKPHETI